MKKVLAIVLLASFGLTSCAKMFNGGRNSSANSCPSYGRTSLDQPTKRI